MDGRELALCAWALGLNPSTHSLQEKGKENSVLCHSHWANSVWL